MPMPSIKELLASGDKDDSAKSDDVADALREMHGHMQTGNYDAAAASMRAVHRIVAAEAKPGGSNDTYD